MRKLLLVSKSLLDCISNYQSNNILYFVLAFGLYSELSFASSNKVSLSGNITQSQQLILANSKNKIFLHPIYLLDHQGNLVSSSLPNIYGYYQFDNLSLKNPYFLSNNFQLSQSNLKDLKLEQSIILSSETEIRNLEVTNSDIIIVASNEVDNAETEQSMQFFDPNLKKKIYVTNCNCLNNATVTGNGQYSTQVRIESGKNEKWFIRYVNGLYSTTSANPPAAPIPFVTGPIGTSFTLISTNDSTSIYGLNGIFISSVGFSIIAENIYGDKLSIGNYRCSYDQPIVLESANNACVNSIIKYSIRNRTNSTYYWSLSSGGSIVSDPNKAAIQVSWTGGAGSTHYLIVKEKNTNYCLEPLTIPVTLGNAEGNVACIGNTQISLGANCQATVTAKHLLVGGPYDSYSYNVLIYNKDGSLVPNNIVTYDHVNKGMLTAKVINTCNNNSCWSKITVEDKLAPTIECQNDTIDCTRMRSHLGPFTYDNCDPNPTKILLSEVIENTPCNNLYSKIVHKKYQTKDASGNLSLVCNADYFLKRINFDSIIFPDSLIKIKNNPLYCGAYPLDSLGRPDVKYTGVPMYFGHPLYPNNDAKYCDYTISFTDYVASQSTCIKKVVRAWKVVIWFCNTTQIRTYTQLIEIVDNAAPVIHCPYDKEVFTNSLECNATIYIEPVQAVDSCNNGVNIILTYPGGFIKNFNGGYITLPVGDHVIHIEAFDNCYNISDCYYNINVIDKAAPIAECDRETVVSLDRFGEAWLPAYVLDDGSYDNCHIKSMRARRMDNGDPCNIKSLVPADSVGFCCMDVGKLVTVLFEVTDESGNTNTCMVQVEVQDKTIPKITCPHDLTINCDYHINRNDLSEFGTATASDNCTVTITENDSFAINQCREGFIYRTFTAGNSFGTSTCTQVITIINDQPFKEGDIQWPSDLETTICDFTKLHPDSLSRYYRPIITEDKCDLVGISYEDQTFKFLTGTDACFKILRKWKVINWCRFRDYRTGDPIIYERVQILKSFNKVAPIILTGCEVQKVQTRDTSCIGGNISLIATAHDDCTDDNELANLFEIDFDRDGRIDVAQSGTGSRIDATGYYRIGQHRIKYIFEDRCGNKSVCEKDFEIENAKLPSAYCKKGIAVGLEGVDSNGDGILDNEVVTVWANDLDQGSNHPCGYGITLSFGKDSSNHSVSYNCDSIGRRTVLLCATATNGQQDCCETFIDVQDNNKVNLCGCLTRPNDLTVNSCDRLTEPANLNSFPIFGLCQCNERTVTHVDAILRNIPNICYRIQRNWTVRFTCQGASEVVNFTQNIDVTTNLRSADIVWPSDSITVDNCDGLIDTSRIGGVPRFCNYAGDVMLMFTDTEIPSRPNTRQFIRRWNVFSKCIQAQSFFFNQKILVISPVGTKITFPADITVNSCSRPFLPDSLNGFPRAACGCDSITNTFRDDTLRNNAEICYQVVRTWNVRVRCRPTIDTLFTGTQRITRDVNLDPNDIVWPVDTFRSFTCTPNSTADRTGRPSLRANYCGLVTFTFSDISVAGVTCTTIRRTWTARNTCSAQVFTRDQILIFFNQGVMTLNCPANITVNADTSACGARVNLLNPSLINSCNFGVSITNNAPNIFPVGLTSVIFTAMDSCSHVARCTMTVTVLETAPPTITCARDTTVNCSVNTTNLSQFGTGIARDNCPGVTIRDSVIRNQNLCGIGTIRRFQIAIDASGNRASCLQTITIVNNDPLDSLEVNWPPSPTSVPECAGIGTNVTGAPTVSAGAASCFRLRIVSTDTSFCSPGNCEVNRRWFVFDSCSNVTLRYTQRIIRRDSVPPTILGIKDTTIFAAKTSCSGFLNIKAFANNCDSNLVTFVNDSRFGGNGKEDASGFYPAGMTNVKFTATDGCCNASMRIIKITVIDTVKPEITCKKAVKVISDNGCATFNVRDAVAFLSDNCSDSSKIKASFSINNFDDTTRTLCCSDIQDSTKQVTVMVTIFFTDEAGNVRSCVTLLQAIDQFNICGGGNVAKVSIYGLLNSRLNKNLANVPVNLTSLSKYSAKTNFGGYYGFGDLDKGGAYTVSPSLDIDHIDGVSTFDIVLIQQHILGKKPFNNPLMHIAADVNKSNTVTSADISEIRKLILGSSERFTKNTSWRFIVDPYVFADPNDPLHEDWPEIYSIPDLQSNTNINFKGIKIGDIDDSQTFAGFSEIKTRSSEITNLHVDNHLLKKGDSQVINIKLNNPQSSLGLQAAINVDSRYLIAEEIDWSSTIGITKDQISIQNNIVKISWVNDSQIKVWNLALKLTALENVELSNHISLANDILLSEAYSSSFEARPLLLKFKDTVKVVTENSLKLYQNIPNPFNQSTKIPFAITSGTEILLEIFDINSKLVYSRKGYFAKGYHEIEISRSDIQQSGVYIYKIHTATEHINNRMMMID